MTAFLEVLQGISNQAAVRSNDIRARPVQSQDAVIAVHADNLVHLWTAGSDIDGQGSVLTGFIICRTSVWEFP